MKTNTYFNLLFLVISIVTFANVTGFTQCQNRSLHLDGVDDYVEVNLTPINTVTNTIEGWFFTTSTSITSSCTGSTETLLWHGSSPTNYISLGECNGELFVEVIGGGSLAISSIITGANIRGGWHHLALVGTYISGVYSVEVYLDCVLVYTMSSPFYSLTNLLIGKHGDPGSFSNNFSGIIDEIRLWNTIPTTQELCDRKDCVLQGKELNLAAYYKFDQGIPGQANQTILSVTDVTGNGYDGVLNNFTLNGNTSNFVCSRSPLIYPDMTQAELVITDYPSRQNTLTNICSGEPMHFCLQLDGMPIAANPNIDVTWQYNNGAGWVNLNASIFNGFCFAVPPNELTIDCTTNILGFEDWDIRGEFTINQSGGTGSCIYYSEITKLNICCPVDMTQVDVLVSDPNNLLCDQDVVNYQVQLNSAYPFISNLAAGINIDWYYNNALIASNNQTSFSYPATVDITTGTCFKATISSCDKQQDFEKCFVIDPIPECGTITDNMMPNNLIFISTDLYEICPGNDASLKIDLPFSNCIPTWQYSFDNALANSWVDLGATNSIQNTNIIPTALWPGTEIWYRIECKPLSDPSGCDPCYSNEIKVELNLISNPGIVTGANFVCSGTTTILTHNNLDPLLFHQWYCNGLAVGNGSATLNASDGGCYWVESINNCYTIKTLPFCLDRCDITPVISCPDVCPRPGVAISLSACDSKDSCQNSLTYQWSVSGSNTPIINGCNITHIPDPGANTYLVTVTNTLGCTATTSTTITPCLN